MTAASLLWISVGALLTTAFVNLGIRALREFSRHDLAEICTRRGKPERFGQILRRHEEVARGVEMISAFTGVLGILAAAAWAALHWEFSLTASPGTLIAASLSLGVVFVYVRTWAPWAGARLFAAGFL